MQFSHAYDTQFVGMHIIRYPITLIKMSAYKYYAKSKQTRAINTHFHEIGLENTILLLSKYYFINTSLIINTIIKIKN